MTALQNNDADYKMNGFIDPEKSVQKIIYFTFQDFLSVFLISLVQIIMNP